MGTNVSYLNVCNRGRPIYLLIKEDRFRFLWYHTEPQVSYGPYHTCHSEVGNSYRLSPFLPPN